MKTRLLAISALAVLGANFCNPVLASSDSLTGDDAPKVVDISPALISNSSKFQRLVNLSGVSENGVYRHKLDLPAGAVMLPGSDEAGKRDLTGDIEVVDSRGNTLGTIDAAWAQDESDQSLPTYFRIEGGTLVQVVDSSTAAGEVTAVLQYTGAAAALGDVSGGAKAYVGIPAGYIYNLNDPKRTLHDFCTKSPNEFPNPTGANADFRGPCARHDVCFEKKQASEYTCNNRLWSDMKSNCEYYYAWYNPTRAACIRTANVYWVAVTANTIWPW